MTTGYFAIRAFARDSKLKLRSCEIFNANVGNWSREMLVLKRKPLRIEVYASEAALELIARGIDTTIAFSINRPDRICAFTKRAPQTFLGLSYFLGDTSSLDPIESWLTTERVCEIISAFHINANESLHIYKNGVSFIGIPMRDIANTGRLLVDMLNLLPQPVSDMDASAVKVEGLIFDAMKLPSELRSLSIFIPKWSTADDELRRQLLASTSRKDKIALLQKVKPFLPIINVYLDSFGTNPLSDEAILLGNLAETVSELMLSDA